MHQPPAQNRTAWKDDLRGEGEVPAVATHNNDRAVLPPVTTARYILGQKRALREEVGRQEIL